MRYRARLAVTRRDGHVFGVFEDRGGLDMAAVAAGGDQLSRMNCQTCHRGSTRGCTGSCAAVKGRRTVPRSSVGDRQLGRVGKRISTACRRDRRRALSFDVGMASVSAPGAEHDQLRAPFPLPRADRAEERLHSSCAGRGPTWVGASVSTSGRIGVVSLFQ